MNNIKKLFEEIQDEFEQAIKTADDIYNDGDITTKKDGYDSLKDYLSSNDNKFFDSTIYPENPWELAPEKVKSFIKESNLRVIEKLKEMLQEDIEMTKAFADKKQQQGDTKDTTLGYISGRLALARDIISDLSTIIEQK